MLIKAGKKIAQFRWVIVALCAFLLIPSFYGMAKTRVNYDVQTYLPKNLETVKGQDILVDEFGTGTFATIVVEDMPLRDVAKMKKKVEKLKHVKNVIWYDSFADLNMPVNMLPKKARDIFFRGDSTMMIVLLDDATSADSSMDTVDEMRELVGKQAYISGMTSIVTDVKNMSDAELPTYVSIAVILCFIALALTMESIVVPILFLTSIGCAIMYNLGTNMFLDDISYVTKALSAVLQLGVTMDYSIFLYNSYEDYKVKYTGEKNRAMGHAIAETFKSVVGSSVTTVAGFIALCFMTFTLGMNIGVVMAKGVVFGVLGCLTLLPSLILIFDKQIDKTMHKPILPNMDRLSAFMTRHVRAWLVVFLVLLAPAIYGNVHTKVYYNMDKSLPAFLDSSIANKKMHDVFEMSNIHMVLLENGSTPKEKVDLINKMEKVKGVEWVMGLDTLVGPGIPDSMIPKRLTESMKNDKYELIFVCSKYQTATTEVNKQVDELEKLVKKTSPGSMVIGEAPLTKDLVDVTDVDFKRVNIISIAAIFVIIMFVFKSLSLPLILVAVIEFAIVVNLSIPYYMGVELPFVASIVIGTIQLGATVDYAILMTSKYQKQRYLGHPKMEAIAIAHKASIKSIIISAISFFAATFGVSLYSNVDMIASLCTLLSRGALISAAVVIFILPAMFMVFDGFIVRTSIGFLPKGELKKMAANKKAELKEKRQNRKSSSAQ